MRAFETGNELPKKTPKGDIGARRQMEIDLFTWTATRVLHISIEVSSYALSDD